MPRLVASNRLELRTVETLGVQIRHGAAPGIAGPGFGVLGVGGMGQGVGCEVQGVGFVVWGALCTLQRGPFVLI